MLIAAVLVFASWGGRAYCQPNLFMDQLTSQADDDDYNDRRISTVKEHVASVPCVYGTSDVYASLRYYDRRYDIVLYVRNNKCRPSMEPYDVLLMRTSDEEVLSCVCMDETVKPWNDVEGFSVGIFYRASIKNNGKVNNSIYDADRMGAEYLDKVCAGLSLVRIETSLFPIELSGEDASRLSEIIRGQYELISRTALEKKSMYDGFR